MSDSMDDILHPRPVATARPEFPHAPAHWDEERARARAADTGVLLTKGSWDVLRFLQEYYAGHDKIEVHRLVRALQQHFQRLGGRRYLYQLFPGGPITQGSRIAGLTPPPGCTDDSFGSSL
jgi:tRNA 2-thiouridine synthesizing protein E